MRLKKYIPVISSSRIRGMSFLLACLITCYLHPPLLHAEPAYDRARDYLNYFLPVFTINKDQANWIGRQSTFGLHFLLPQNFINEDTRQGLKPDQLVYYARGVELIPLVLGSPAHPALLKCEFYALPRDYTQRVSIALHRCTAGFKFTQLREQDNSACSTAQPTDPGACQMLDAGNLPANLPGWFVLVKVKGLRFNITFNTAGGVQTLETDDTGLQVLFKLQKLTADQPSTANALEESVIAFAQHATVENLGAESGLITFAVHAAFFLEPDNPYVRLKNWALSKIHEELMATVTGPISLRASTGNAQDKPGPLVLTVPEPKVGEIGSAATAQHSAADATHHLVAYLESPGNATLLNRAIDFARAHPNTMMPEILSRMRNDPDPTRNRQLVILLMEINTHGDPTAHPPTYGSMDALQFMLGHPLKSKLGPAVSIDDYVGGQSIAQLTLNSVSGLHEYSPLNAEIMTRVWAYRPPQDADIGVPLALRTAIGEKFSTLDFFGQQRVAELLGATQRSEDGAITEDGNRELLLSGFENRCSRFRGSDHPEELRSALGILGTLRTSSEALELIGTCIRDPLTPEPPTSALNPIIRIAAYEAAGKFGDQAYEILSAACDQEVEFRSNQNAQDACWRVLATSGPLGLMAVNRRLRSLPTLTGQSPSEEHFRNVASAFVNAELNAVKERYLSGTLPRFEKIDVIDHFKQVGWYSRSLFNAIITNPQEETSIRDTALNTFANIAYEEPIRWSKWRDYALLFKAEDAYLSHQMRISIEGTAPRNTPHTRNASVLDHLKAASFLSADRAHLYLYEGVNYGPISIDSPVWDDFANTFQTDTPVGMNETLLRAQGKLRLTWIDVFEKALIKRAGDSFISCESEMNTDRERFCRVCYQPYGLRDQSSPAIELDWGSARVPQALYIHNGMALRWYTLLNMARRFSQRSQSSFNRTGVARVLPLLKTLYTCKNRAEEVGSAEDLYRRFVSQTLLPIRGSALASADIVLDDQEYREEYTTPSGRPFRDLIPYSLPAAVHIRNTINDVCGNIEDILSSNPNYALFRESCHL